MPCDISAGRALACKEFLGGVGSIYLFNGIDNPFTVANALATAINPLLTDVYEFKINGDGSGVEQSFVSDRNTGTSVNTQTTTAILKGVDAATSNTLNNLVKGHPMAVVKDRNGGYYAIGIYDGIDFTVVQTTGTAKAELVGYTLTGLSMTGELAPRLDTATTSAFLALVN